MKREDILCHINMIIAFSSLRNFVFLEKNSIAYIIWHFFHMIMKFQMFIQNQSQNKELLLIPKEWYVMMTRSKEEVKAIISHNSTYKLLLTLKFLPKIHIKKNILTTLHPRDLYKKETIILYRKLTIFLSKLYGISKN